MNEVLLIDKPPGITSFDVIDEFKKLLGTKKVGHSGTLDRFATGLLVLCTGWATKLTRFFIDNDKSYTGTIQLGISTDTCDVDGKIIRTEDVSRISSEDILKIEERFKGDILQSPPVFCAIKTGGVRASDLIRRGITPELKDKKVSIKRLDIHSIDLENSQFIIDIVCSKGTYIRALARDIGDFLGTGAFLKTLRRTSSGNFNVDNAVTIEEFREYQTGKKIEKDFCYSPVDAISSFGFIIVKDRSIIKVLNGAPIKKDDIIEVKQSGNNPFRIMDEGKNLIAIADMDIINWTINYLNVFSSK